MPIKFETVNTEEMYTYFPLPIFLFKVLLGHNILMILV